MNSLMALPCALLCALLLCPAAGNGAAAAEPAGECAAITYSTNPEYPPYDWAVGEQGFDGASIELLEMAAPPGVALRPVVYPWKRSQHMARQGKIDLLVSLRITPERSEYLEFTTHRAFPNPIVIFVRKDRAFPYASWADLKGRRGGISFGDTFGAGFDEYWRAELTVEQAPTMQDNFQKLDMGRIDYFVTSKFVGEAYFATAPLRHEVVSLAPPISEQDIHFGFSRQSRCVALAEEFSRRLAELDRQGVPERLIGKHLKRYVAGHGRP